MTPLIDLSIWVNKSGSITLDTPLSDPTITPTPLTNIVFLMSSQDTWIRLKSFDGNVYFHYLKALTPYNAGVPADQLSQTQITSSGNNWQGNAIPSETVGNLYWLGN